MTTVMVPGNTRRVNCLTGARDLLAVHDMLVAHCVELVASSPAQTALHKDYSKSLEVFSVYVNAVLIRYLKIIKYALTTVRMKSKRLYFRHQLYY